MEVDVTLVLGPDAESDRVLEIAREAARILKDNYGIWAYIVPVTVWGHHPGTAVTLLGDTMIPVVYINGYPVPPARLRTPEDLADHIVSLLMTRIEEEGPMPSAPSHATRISEATVAP